VGELLLCNRPMAAMPYYIEELSLNIYSLEELCYVIEHYAYLIEEQFFCDELIQWIGRDAGDDELAEQLRQSKENESDITKLVELVLNATGYLNYSRGLNVVSQIRQMQHKSVFERRKIRADRYVENRKYISALLEYRRILQMEEECRKNPIVCGNIWHNQGTVYARMFLFKEARECFETAYKYHMNVESIYAAMLSSRYLGDEEAVRGLAKVYGVDEQEIADVEERWNKAVLSETVMKQAEKIESFFEEKEESIEENAELMQMLQEWKREYH